MVQYNDLTAEQKITITTYLESVKGYAEDFLISQGAAVGEPIIDFVLVGSYFSGDADEWSDMDIFAIHKGDLYKDFVAHADGVTQSKLLKRVHIHCLLKPQCILNGTVPPLDIHIVPIGILNKLDEAWESIGMSLSDGTVFNEVSDIANHYNN